MRYSGFVRIAGATTEIRVAYWYAVKGGEAAAIPLLARTASGCWNGELRNSIYFRVTDAAGVPVPGEGAVIGIASLNSESSELFGGDSALRRLGGSDTFRVRAGK